MQVKMITGVPHCLCLQLLSPVAVASSHEPWRDSTAIKQEMGMQVKVIIGVPRRLYM